MASNTPYQQLPDGEAEEKRADVRVNLTKADREAAKKASEDKMVAGTDHHKGLTRAEYLSRMAKYGKNELASKESNPCLEFLSFFWGPMPIMIWIAIVVEMLEVFVSDEPEKWADVAVLLILQIVNGGVGWHEHHKAADAIAALKDSLAPKASVKRDGVWIDVDASDLVPGDLVTLALGAAVPADCRVIGKRGVHCNQAALNGEAIPKEIKPGDNALMGSSVTSGEAEAIVVWTGGDTFLGDAASLVAAVDEPGNFQKVLYTITLFLMVVAFLLVGVILVALLLKHEDFFETLGVCIVLLVASIPIAMQVVCTTTMAIGSRRLSEKKAIVTRLSAIEELAGMDWLCSDKTGTLTLGQMVMQPPITYREGATADTILRDSALAAKWMETPKDAIDTLILTAAKENATIHSQLAEYESLDYIPFDPSTKRTEGLVRHKATGKEAKYTKGAPPVILGMCDPDSIRDIREEVEAKIEELAEGGVRALGLASFDAEINGWVLEGILTFLDPPRHDSAETIRRAQELGITVQMITGDQLLIARDTCKKLNLGGGPVDRDGNYTVYKIEGTENLPEARCDDEQDPQFETLEEYNRKPEVVKFKSEVETINGFSEVWPAHKYQIVQTLRELGHRCGMTGDGVNDAPALKRADVGIAVEGATDAAVAAADIVLTEPGLSVIIDAIKRSRKIFQRMKNYVTYRVACTIQLLLFFFISCLLSDPSGSPIRIDTDDNKCDMHYFVLPVISLVIITILNDGTIITIAYDEVHPGQQPEKWNLMRLNIVAVVLGLTACASTLLLLFIGLEEGHHMDVCDHANHTKTGHEYLHKWFSLPTISFEQLQCAIYLKISLSDFMTVFAARTTGPFWERRPGYALLIAFLCATFISTLMATNWHFGDMKSISWGYALFCWIYCSVCFLIQDFLKVMTFKVLDSVQIDEDAFTPEAGGTIDVMRTRTASLMGMDNQFSFLAKESTLSGSQKVLRSQHSAAGAPSTLIRRQTNPMKNQ